MRGGGYGGSIESFSTLIKKPKNTLTFFICLKML